MDLTASVAIPYLQTSAWLNIPAPTRSLFVQPAVDVTTAVRINLPRKAGSNDQKISIVDC